MASVTFPTEKVPEEGTESDNCASVGDVGAENGQSGTGGGKKQPKGKPSAAPF